MSQTGPRFTYLRSRTSIRISPANRAGFLAFLGWMLALVPLAAAFIWAMSSLRHSAAIAGAIALYVAGMLGWFFAMFRWMKARSEIVDLDELLAIKRERDRQR